MFYYYYFHLYITLHDTKLKVYHCLPFYLCMTISTVKHTWEVFWRMLVAVLFHSLEWHECKLTEFHNWVNSSSFHTWFKSNPGHVYVLVLLSIIALFPSSILLLSINKKKLHDTSEYSLATNPSAVCSRLYLSNQGEFLFYTFSYEIPPPHFVWKFLKTRTHPVWSEWFLTHSAPPALSKCGLKNHIAWKIMTMMAHHASIVNFFTRVRGHD